MGTSKWFTSAALSAALAALTTPALAADLSMWVRASGANAAQHLIDLWNSGHPDKINLTVIPDNQMVSKLATGVKAGEVPDAIERLLRRYLETRAPQENLRQFFSRHSNDELREFLAGELAAAVARDPSPGRVPHGVEG